MPFSLEYHTVVECPAQRSLSALLTLFGMLLLPLLAVFSATAQTNSSPAIPARAVSPPAPSVAPPARNNFAPPASSLTPPTKIPHSPKPPTNTPPPTSNQGIPQHPTANSTTYYPYVYLVPYAVDPSIADASDDDNNDYNNDHNDDPGYQGGPTIFDRRGSGADSYPPPVSMSPAEVSPEVAQAENVPDAYPDPDPAPPLAPTILVFKDGHQLEVANYAIVNQTLYDLTPGHRRKVALADLDLPATEKQNDDQGIVFQLPPSAQAN